MRCCYAGATYTGLFPGNLAIGPLRPISSSYGAGISGDLLTGRISFPSGLPNARQAQSELLLQFANDCSSAVRFVQPWMKSPWKPKPVVSPLANTKLLGSVIFSGIRSNPNSAPIDINALGWVEGHMPPSVFPPSVGSGYAT